MTEKTDKPITERKPRPGVMVYFADYEKLRSLSPDQRVKIMDAFMEYSQYGVKPEFGDAFLQTIWDFGKFELMADMDREKYLKRQEKAIAAANKRWEEEHKKEKTPSREELLSLESRI